MGLLTQALAGGISSGANAAAGLMAEKMKNDWQAERDKAQELREENLTRLRAQLQDTSEIGKEQRAATAKDNDIDPDLRLNGDFAPRGLIKSQVANNILASKAQSDVDARKQAVDNQYEDADETDPRPDATSEYEDSMTNAGASDKEKGIIALAKPITSSKETALQAKIDNMKEMSEAKIKALTDDMHTKYDALEKINANRDATRKEISDATLEYKKTVDKLQEKLVNNQLENAKFIANMNNDRKTESMNERDAISETKAADAIEKAYKDIGGYDEMPQTLKDAVDGHRKEAQRLRGRDIPSDTPTPQSPPVIKNAPLANVKAAVATATTRQQAMAILKSQGYTHVDGKPL